MNISKEQFEKISKAWDKNEHYKLIFEWVKTGVISFSQYREIQEMIEEWDAPGW